jgi:hypothetical protein
MSKPAATEQQIQQLAQNIINRIEAIRDNTLVGPRYAAIKNVQDSIDCLAVWVGDDR